MNPPISNVKCLPHRGPFLGGLTRFEKVQKLAQIYGQKPTMKKGLVFGHLFEVPKVPKSTPQTTPPPPSFWGGGGVVWGALLGTFGDPQKVPETSPFLKVGF